MVAGRLTKRPRPTDSSRLPLAVWTAWAMAGCEGAATSVAAIRPTARVRASAAALKLALLFILLTPNRNFGHLVAAGHAHDRTDRRGRLATLAGWCISAPVLWLRARRADAAAHRDPETRDVAAGRRRRAAGRRTSGGFGQHLLIPGGEIGRATFRTPDT